ncbi:MAG: DoxX family protein [Flavobacteriales bacterium]|nr:DoxX family protein [Flavobacteriales bacterium]
MTNSNAMNEMRLRNQKLDLFGRSMILNVASIVLNLIGVFLVVKGFHAYTTENAAIYKILGFSLVAATLFGLVILKGLYLYSFVSRALVGGLFIVSGLVKANDPLGFAFKLEEYFAPNGLAYDYPFFEFFEPYTLELSILICIAEIVLGVAVILGGKIKLASWSLVIMMAFFTWLTWYTTSCNEAQMLAMSADPPVPFEQQCVTDCGCFGDALRGSVGRSLTPAESFWKDLVLFYFVLIIFANQWKIEMNTVRQNWAMVPTSFLVVIFFCWVFGWGLPIFFTLIAILGSFIVGNLNIGKMGKAWKMAIFVTLLSFIFSFYTTMYLPVKDYRPYAIGNNIQEQMANGVDEVVELKLVYKNLQNGQEESFGIDEWEIYMDTSKYEFVKQDPKVIVEGIPHSIQDFAASMDYAVMTEEEKQVPYIDSVIQMEYENYYDELITLEGPYGTETISSMDYDTIYYPDSLYQASEPYVALMDSTLPFMIDLTDYLINADYMFLMTIRKIEDVNEGHMTDFKAVYEKATEAGIPFYVLSPATDEQVAEFKTKHDFNATFLSFDGTEIKIIVRSNPGLVLLNKGTILDKWPCRSVPDFEDIQEDYLQAK